MVVAFTDKRIHFDVYPQEMPGGKKRQACSSRMTSRNVAFMVCFWDLALHWLAYVSSLLGIRVSSWTLTKARGMREVARSWFGSRRKRVVSGPGPMSDG